MTRLRIGSWLFIFGSPLLIALYKLIETLFQSPSNCSGMGCLAIGLGEFFLIMFIYLAFLLIGILLNLIDFIKTRKTASAWRKFEIIIFTAPVWLWIFAIPRAIQNIVEQRKIDELFPYMQTITYYENANYDELLIAIEKVSSADPEITNNFPNLDLNLRYAKLMVSQIDFINKNKQRELPLNFALKPFQLCIRDMGTIASNEPWRFIFYKGEGFNELNLLSDSEKLIFGETDSQGCSKVTDASLLTSIIKQGNTLFMVVGSRVIFIDVDLPTQTLTVERQLSTYHYEIDIQPLP